jgi:hypothetical protein
LGFRCGEQVFKTKVFAFAYFLLIDSMAKRLYNRINFPTGVPTMRKVLKYRRQLFLCSTGIGLALLCLTVFLPQQISAQEVTAAITGRVTDPTGAAIAGAKVTATDTQRGTQWPTVTNSDGVYNLPRVPVGTYTVKVENQGFQSAQQSNITLVLNQVARLDFSLQVGEVSQSVEVTSAAPLLQTEQTALGQVIDSRTNTELPLATRNYVQLTLLAPGSVHPDPSSFKNGQTTASSGRPYVNGNREQANNFLLDGVDNNQVSDNLVGYAPSVDAIQEFNEITQNASSEFGNFMGGIISTTIKSGTNAFHGGVFEFFRNDKLNANEWSNNFSGAPRNALRWNNFGGTFGGPIKKDKLFFFVDYQGQRFSNPTTTNATSLLTGQERAGDFSQLLSPALTNGKPVQLKDPRTGVPIPGNIIPASLLSPVANKIVTSQFYPLPTANTLINNFLYSTHSAINGDQGDAKVDWNISDKDRMFGRYSQSLIDNPVTNSLPLAYNSFNNFPVHNGVLDWTRTISPSIVNDARVGVNYVLVNNGSASNSVQNFAQTVGIPDVPSTFLPSMSLTTNNIANTCTASSCPGIGTADIYQLFADTVIQYGDTLIVTKGNHTMHMGFQGWRQRVNTFYSGNNGRAGTFTFDGRYSNLADADFIMGLPSQVGGGVNGGTWGQRANVFGAFFQDDWRVTPKLTVNLGLRYELHTPWVEVKDRQRNFGLLSGEILVPGQNGASRALYNQYNGVMNWQPRIGIAYTASNSVVVRAAYGLSSYLEGTGTNLRLPINPPFASEHLLDYTRTQSNLPGSTLDQGYTPFSAGENPFLGATLRVWDPNVRPALSNQWNFTVQKQLGNSTTFQVGYVGQRTTHLMVPMPYFQRQLISPGVVASSPYLAGNPALTGAIGQISGTASNGNQSYHALQAVFQRRMAAGLQFNVAYTWSKCMSNAIGYYGAGGQSGSQSAYWQNVYDMAAEWGPCFYDVSHVGTANVIYELPFGRNRAFGKNLNPIVNGVIGDWQVSGIVSLHTGFPMTITANDTTGTGSRGARASCIAPGDVFGYRSSPTGGYQWFDPNSYAQPQGTFGSCGVGTIRGPGLKTVDMSLVKQFPITERQNLEIRGEAINLTNTPILNAPNRSVGSNLGLITASQGARNIQLGIKYNF